MAPLAPIDQEAVFYIGSWTMEVEYFFVEKLVNEVLFGSYRLGASNNKAIYLTMRDVNQKFQTNFNYKFCFVKHLKLKCHYFVFNWIIHLSGVSYNPITNLVKCSDDAWEFICEKEKLARVYMKNGEPLFEELKLLFEGGPDSIDGLDVVPVIEISSDHEEDDQIILGGLPMAGDTSNEWGNEVALGYQDDAVKAEVSQSSNFSSIERDTSKLKKPVNSGRNVTRRLWSDEGSSSMPFSPVKKS